MWLSEDEHLILKYLESLKEVGASMREVCRKSSTKDRWKENERWAYPILSGLKDKKMVETTPNGNYRLPQPDPKKEAEKEEEKKRRMRATSG